MFKFFKRKTTGKTSIYQLSLEEKEYLCKNDNKTLCNLCKYECCKDLGCQFSPDDFPEITFECLKEEMKKGYIAIVCAVSQYDENRFILQARMKNCPIIDMGYFSNQRTECVFLTQHGCSKSKKDRPKGENRNCRVDVFNRVRCEPKYNVEQCATDWKPYRELLFELANEFGDYPNNYPYTEV